MMLNCTPVTRGSTARGYCRSSASPHPSSVNNSHEKTLATSENNFGENLRATGPMAEANRFRFSTKYQDDETDLLYYGYRYYSASVGCWASRDPIEEDGGANLYGFALNIPNGFIDPLGDCACSCVAIHIFPDEKNFKVDFYPTAVVDFLGNPQTQFRLGFPISVRFEVTGNPNLCEYYVDEKKGGVSGSAPDGKFSSPAKEHVRVPHEDGKAPEGQDRTGIVVTKLGEYMVKYKLRQTWTCVGSDGRKLTEKRHWKKDKVIKAYPPRD